MLWFRTNTEIRTQYLEAFTLRQNRGKERKEGNVVFNDALNTFYLRLYGIRPLRYPEKKPAAATWATLSD